ncbi:MAG TPA: class I SAM-dependent methyltransferase [Aliiroseovarius sp.]|nr:class I SAM-dependent methyltransferase [Aliiroseovarius sp.]
MSDQTNDGKAIFLKDAYALENTEDSLELYDKWAENYDETFAKANDYNTPDLIADLYAEHTRDKSALVLDIGAGTGLVAEGLARRGISHVEALDISEKMLAVARRKGVYQRFIIADLNQRLEIPDATYAGFTCTGTFTHGHVGPDALDELVRIGRNGALYVLGIKAAIYESAGFAAKFKSLAPQLAEFRIVEKKGYGENADKALQASTTAVAVFRKI